MSETLSFIPARVKEIFARNGVMWGPIGREVYQRTYSRPKPDGTQEAWEDTVLRVVHGNLDFVDRRFHEPGEREKLIEMMYRMDIVPAGRHLWCTGVKDRSYVNNCFSIPWPSTIEEHFSMMFEVLMKGGGAGSNYSNRYIGKYPAVGNRVNVGVTLSKAHPDHQKLEDVIIDSLSDVGPLPEYMRVDDSREGWCQAMAFLVRSFWDGTRDVIFDVSALRERGAKLKTFGGISAGPEPLVVALLSVGKILNSYVGRKLPSLAIMEIDHEIARSVVSGNIRRSARMSIKSWEDEDIFDFILSKRNMDSHWSTNISVEIDDEFIKAATLEVERASEIMDLMCHSMREHGEPGFVNRTLAEVGERGKFFTFNPCGEIAFSGSETEGSSDVCCLGHVNLSSSEFMDLEKADEAFRLMARFLVRATFANPDNERVRAEIDKNRRIGVGFFGFHEWVVRKGVKWSDAGRTPQIALMLEGFSYVVRQEAFEYAKALGIPEPVKVTAVAPTGTISNLCGATSGCQPIYSRYFRRRVNYASNDPALKSLAGYEQEDSVYTPNTKVVSFYCKSPIVRMCEDEAIDLALVEEQSEIPLERHLEVQAMIQSVYADNAVSYTINFDPEKVGVGDLKEALISWLPHLKGTTAMPEVSKRPQMPFERITREEFEEAERRGQGRVGDAERECKNGSCPVK